MNKKMPIELSLCENVRAVRSLQGGRAERE